MAWEMVVCSFRVNKLPGFNINSYIFLDVRIRKSGIIYGYSLWIRFLPYYREEG